MSLTNSDIRVRAMKQALKIFSITRKDKIFILSLIFSTILIGGYYTGKLSVKNSLQQCFSTNMSVTGDQVLPCVEKLL